MSSPADPPFDEVLAACLDELERDGSAALERACARHPELAARLRRRVGLLAAANLLEVEGEAELPDRLGDFDVLERLGAGAMGVVHRARQRSTGRDVALKLVRPEQLVFPGARARFRREVELAARLAHPAILPVIAVGEDGGLPWFAMELVRGPSLAALLDALRARGADADAVDPSTLPELVLALTPADLGDGARFPAPRSWRAWALGAARDVAGALAHAHRKGVLHRDVKPSNVLVGADGRVHLADLGLASAPGAAASLTRTSSAVGSLPYMAPEVLGGAGADARSDVYGAGALLYELLTLARPFAQEPAPALVAAILAGDLVPPRRRAAVGRDAEAVVLRALERDPARRHATADELCADLDALIAGAPPRSRPLSGAARVLRAVRRRPAASAAAALALLGALAGPVGWQLKGRRTLADVRASFAEERDARARAERHLGAALAAIGSVLRETATDELEDVPRMQRARLAGVERALALVAELEADRPEDPAVRTERAELHRARAEVLYDLGRHAEAHAEAERAVALARGLSRADPTPARRHALAEALQVQAKLAQALLRYSDAVPLQRELLAELRAARAGGAGSDSDLALALADLAESLAVVAGPTESEEALAEGHALAVRAAVAAPADAHAAWTAGRLACDRADARLALGDVRAAAVLADEALAHHRTGAALAPESRFHAYDVAVALDRRASIAVGEGDAAHADALLAEAEDGLARLVRDYPDSLRYRLFRSFLRDKRTLALRALGRVDECLPRLEASVAELDALVEAHPERLDLRVPAALHRNNLANHLVHSGARLDEARALCARGLELLEPCRGLETRPVPVAAFELRLRYLHALARCFQDDLDVWDEIEAYERDARDAHDLRYAADLWNEWALAARRARADDAARAEAEARLFACLRRAIEGGYDDLRELSTTPALDAYRGGAELEELLDGLRERR